MSVLRRAAERAAIGEWLGSAARLYLSEMTVGLAGLGDRIGVG